MECTVSGTEISVMMSNSRELITRLFTVGIYKDCVIIYNWIKNKKNSNDFILLFPWK